MTRQIAESSALCRVVELEWDRGHESFEGIVRAQTEAGIIFSPIDELTAAEGLIWIRGNELLKVDDLSSDHPVVRLANLHGSRTNTIDSALTELLPLLDHLAKTAALIQVHQARTGSDEALVGKIVSSDDQAVILDEVDTNGHFTGGTDEFITDEIISIQWGTRYLKALTELTESELAESELTESNGGDGPSCAGESTPRN